MAGEMSSLGMALRSELAWQKPGFFKKPGFSGRLLSATSGFCAVTVLPLWGVSSRMWFPDGR